MKKLISIIAFCLTLTANAQTNQVGINIGLLPDRNIGLYYEHINNDGSFGLRPFVVVPVTEARGTDQTSRVAMGAGADFKIYMGDFDHYVRYYTGISAAFVKLKAYPKRWAEPLLVIGGVSANIGKLWNLNLGAGAGVQLQQNNMNHTRSQTFVYRLDLGISIRF